MLFEILTEHGFRVLRLSGGEQRGAQRFANGEIPVRRLGIVQGVLRFRGGAPVLEGFFRVASRGSEPGLENLRGDGEDSRRGILVPEAQVRRNDGGFRAEFAEFGGSTVSVSSCGEREDTRRSEERRVGK